MRSAGRLKDNPATHDIPIIFLTAKTEEMDEEKGFDVGAVDYIHKPFSGAIGTVIPRRYENVAVLFCDVTNFTAYCDKHEPEDVVSRLDALFIIFERITAKHGL